MNFILTHRYTKRIDISRYQRGDIDSPHFKRVWRAQQAVENH
jgi:hypothetical protein